MTKTKRLLPLIASAILLTSAPAMADGDVGAGERVFKKCKACHNVEKNKHKVGPTLVGIIGRTAGTAKDQKSKLFRYSKAMKQAGVDGIIWNAENLDKYLTKPKAFIPKNKMSFRGLKKPADRANVIAYLESLARE